MNRSPSARQPCGVVAEDFVCSSAVVDGSGCTSQAKLVELVNEAGLNLDCSLSLLLQTLPTLFEGHDHRVSLGFACERGDLRCEAVGFGAADIESHNRMCRQSNRSVATLPSVGASGCTGKVSKLTHGSRSGRRASSSRLSQCMASKSIRICRGDLAGLSLRRVLEEEPELLDQHHQCVTQLEPVAGGVCEEESALSNNAQTVQISSRSIRNPRNNAPASSSVAAWMR